MEIVDWYSAELAATIHLRSLGFDDARTTGAGADRGLDVVGRGVGAQVKYLSNPVGAPDVQRLRGAAGLRVAAVFYSLSGYTRQATLVAENAEVALFRYDRTGEIDPVNTRAGELLARDGADRTLISRSIERGQRINRLLDEVAELSTKLSMPAESIDPKAIGTLLQQSINAMIEDTGATIAAAIGATSDKEIVQRLVKSSKKFTGTIEEVNRGHLQVREVIEVVTRAASIWRKSHDLSVKVLAGRGSLVARGW